MNLSVFRTLAFLGALLTYDHSQTMAAAALPDELRFPPPGLWWVVGVVPFDPSVVALVAAVFVGACVVGVVGWGGRWPAVVAFLAGLYVLGVPQMHGKVHHYHQAVWLLAFVAAVPPAWMPSWPEILRGGGRDGVPAKPLHALWLFMGVLYFFPGFWKAGVNAHGWFAGDTFRNYLWYKWAETGTVSVLRLDASPWLYRPAGALVVVWELTFLLAMLNERTRKVWAAFGASFHVTTWVTMRIFSASFFLLYLTFIDWGRFAPGVRTVRGSTRGLDLMAGTTIALFIGAGFTYTDSWPVSVFPTFARDPASNYTRIIAGGTDVHGTTGLDAARTGALVRRVLDLPAGERRAAALQALGSGPFYIERTPIRPGGQPTLTTVPR